MQEPCRVKHRCCMPLITVTKMWPSCWLTREPTLTQRAIEKERRDKVRELNAEIGARAIDAVLVGVRQLFDGIDAIAAYLDEVRADLIENVALFLQQEAEQAQAQFPVAPAPGVVNFTVTAPGYQTLNTEREALYDDNADGAWEVQSFALAAADISVPGAPPSGG